MVMSMQNKSEIIYLDDNRNIVPKEKATKAIIRELDSDGNLVREIFGTIDQDVKEHYSDEEIDAIQDKIQKEQTKNK